MEDISALSRAADVKRGMRSFHAEVLWSLRSAGAAAVAAGNPKQRVKRERRRYASADTQALRNSLY
jgi:hypothetical protein